MVEFPWLSKDRDRIEVLEQWKVWTTGLADGCRLALTRSRCVFLLRLTGNQATERRILLLDEMALCTSRSAKPY